MCPIRYEFYYDIVLGGQYTFHIARLHEKYGPVIRINPHELHVHTPEFFDTLYVNGQVRHKSDWTMRGFGVGKSAFGTLGHDLHRMRRSALNPFFSTARVRKLEPLMEERTDALMKRLGEFQEDGSIMTLEVAFSAYTAGMFSHNSAT